jgi:hypothetical protein
MRMPMMSGVGANVARRRRPRTEGHHQRPDDDEGHAAEDEPGRRVVSDQEGRQHEDEDAGNQGRRNPGDRPEDLARIGAPLSHVSPPSAFSPC